MGTINNFGNILLPANSNTINVQTLLTSVEEANAIPMDLLQQKQNALQTQSSTLTSIEGDIDALGTAVSALSNTNGSINSLTATSSDSNLVTATADPTAIPSSHTIVVNSLATTASYYTDPVDPSTALGAGSFQIAVGSNAPVTVTVDNTDNTLSGLAAAINKQSVGVTASVINDANGSRLALVSNTSGSTGNITISNNTTSLNFHSAVTGANASLTVDGVPISSASNTVSTVIPGVTLSLVGANSGVTVGLTLSPDANQATGAINQFVSSWNKVIQDLNGQFDVSSNGTGGGPLEADNTLRSVQDQLLSAITASVAGNNGFVNLATIGVNMNQDGTLSVDSGVLSNALNNNFSSVQNLLQGAGGVATYLSTTLNQITDPTQGSISLDLQGMSQQNQDLTQQISNIQTQLMTQDQLLVAEYTQMQNTLDEMPMLQTQITQQLGSLG